MEAAVEGDDLLGFRPLILGFLFLALNRIFAPSDVSFEDAQEGLAAKN